MGALAQSKGEKAVKDALGLIDLSVGSSQRKLDMRLAISRQDPIFNADEPWFLSFLRTDPAIIPK